MVMISAYAVVPSSRQQLMRDYLKEATGERVLFKQTPAWVVELPSLRRVQREWAQRKNGEPTIEKCLHWLALASGNLFRPIPDRGFPWKECFWREELCRLKVAAVQWLARMEGTTVRHVWLKQEAMGWLGQTPISLDECRFAMQRPGELTPVLVAGSVAAAVPALTDEWEGAPIVEQVPNATDRNGRRRSAEVLATKLWSFIPEPDPDNPIPDIVSSVHHWSVSWPGQELSLQRSTDGKRAMPDWLKELPTRRAPY